MGPKKDWRDNSQIFFKFHGRHKFIDSKSSVKPKQDKTKRGKNEKKGLNTLREWQSSFLKLEEHCFYSLASHYWQKERKCTLVTHNGFLSNKLKNLTSSHRHTKLLQIIHSSKEKLDCVPIN